MKYERIFLLIIFPLTYIVSIMFMLQKFIGALTIIMLLPAFAAVISILIEFKSFNELLKPFSQKISFKSLTFSIIFPLAGILFCMFTALLIKQGALLANWNSILLSIVNIMLISIVFFIIGLFEEYGWRGYLLPRLIKKYNFRKANLITGILVVFYHIPIILILNLHYGISKGIIYTLLQSAAVFMMNYAFTYLFILSPNVILPSIMHTLWINLNLAILGCSYQMIPVQGYIIGKPQIINGQGLLGLIYFSLFAIYAYRKFSKQTL